MAIASFRFIFWKLTSHCTQIDDQIQIFVCFFSLSFISRSQMWISSYQPTKLLGCMRFGDVIVIFSFSPFWSCICNLNLRIISCRWLHRMQNHLNSNQYLNVHFSLTSASNLLYWLDDGVYGGRFSFFFFFFLFFIMLSLIRSIARSLSLPLLRSRVHLSVQHTYFVI